MVEMAWARGSAMGCSDVEGPLATDQVSAPWRDAERVGVMPLADVDERGAASAAIQPR